MLNSRTGSAMVGTGALMTLLVALAVVAGIVPHGTGTTPQPELAAASVTPQPAPVPETAAAVEAPAPAPEAAPAPAPTAAPVHHAAPVAEAPAEEPGDDSSGPAAAAAAPASTRVARTTPSSAQVQAAIQGFHARIPMYTPTAAQVADFGNQVCSAFDAGQSYAQVKAAGLAKVAGNPFVTVSSSDADWMIRTAVSMYCPGYAGRLS